MRRFYLLCLILCAVTLVPGVQAQNLPASAIEALDIQFWPDYDRQSVLILLTGTLSNSGTVSVPFPENGDFLVLARIDSSNAMIDDIGQPIIENGLATFTLPAPNVQFRLEYYVPYTLEGNTRSFAYTWQAGIPANGVTMRVQRPTAATTLVTVPEAAEQVRGQSDGLIYYNLPVTSAAAGQPLTVQVSYTMGENTLTASTLSSIPVPGASVGEETAVSSGADINWGLILGGVALVLATAGLTWLIATQPRGSKKARKPAPYRKPKPARPTPPPQKRAAPKPSPQPTTRFCHECGEQAQPEDRFCRSCGTTLR